jgi:Poxvirus Late Transcription Factor VLTF3 like
VGWADIGRKTAKPARKAARKLAARTEQQPGMSIESIHLLMQDTISIAPRQLASRAPFVQREQPGTKAPALLGSAQAADVRKTCPAEVGGPGAMVEGSAGMAGGAADEASDDDSEAYPAFKPIHFIVSASGPMFSGARPTKAHARPRDVCTERMAQREPALLAQLLGLRADIEGLDQSYKMATVGVLSRYYGSGARDEASVTQDYYRLVQQENFISNAELILSKVRAIADIIYRRDGVYAEAARKKGAAVGLAPQKKAARIECNAPHKKSAGFEGGTPHKKGAAVGLNPSKKGAGVEWGAPQKKGAAAQANQRQILELDRVIKLCNNAKAIHVTEYSESQQCGLCTTCGTKMMVVNELSELHCLCCGEIKEIVGSVTREEPSTLNESHKPKSGGYDTSRHYKFWMERLQALENFTFDAIDLAKIEYVVTRDGYPRSKLACEVMRRILKDSSVNGTYLNEHAPLLVKTFGGRPPPILTHAENSVVAVRFNKVMKLYELVNPSGGNKPYYPYFIYKIIEQEFRNNAEKLRLRNRDKKRQLLQKNMRYRRRLGQPGI